MTIAYALQLHRAGKLIEAEALYRELLDAHPDDANLLGLLGILALQSGSAAEAESLIVRSLGLDSPDQIRVRNLNTLAVMHFDAGRQEAARDAIRDHLPKDAIDPPEVQAEVGAVISLASCAHRLGAAEEAGRLADALEQGLAAVGADQVEEAGILLAGLGRSDAVQALADAAGGRTAGRDFWLKVGAAAHETQNTDLRELAEDRICREFPVLVDPNDRPCRVRVINWTPDFQSLDPVACYIPTNSIGALAQTCDGDEFAFDGILARDLGEVGVPAGLPQPDIVFNNLVNAEFNILQDNARIVAQIGEHFDVPVLNDPAIVAQTTREENYRRLGNIPGLVFPRTTTYLLRDEPAELFAGSIAAQFGLPIVIRSVTGHESLDMRLCRSRDEVCAAIEALKGRYFYAVEYVDCPVERGIWRKFRIICCGEAILGHKLCFGTDWLVNASSWRRLGPDRPDLQREEERFLADPLGYLGTDAERVIGEIRARTPLDYLGIDFTIDEAGRLVVFEVNASMRALPAATSRSAFPYPDANRAKIRAALEELLRGQAASARRVRRA